MSRKLLALLTALLLLLALATFVYYRRTLAAVPVDPYALVPDDAVLVLSTRDHPALVRHLQETELWDNLTAVRYFQQAASHLALADSLTGGPARRRSKGGVLRSFVLSPPDSTATPSACPESFWRYSPRCCCS